MPAAAYPLSCALIILLYVQRGHRGSAFVCSAARLDYSFYFLCLANFSYQRHVGDRTRPRSRVHFDCLTF